MRRQAGGRGWALALWVGAAACGLEAPSGGADGGVGGGRADAGSALAEEMLAAHNQVRALAQPTPQPALAPLTWSAEAAAVAEAWAARCEWGHNPQRGTLGENLYASAPPGLRGAPDAVREWAAEAASYDWTRNACALGRECGHYTQLVWRDTRAVGCATRVCTGGSPLPGSTTWQLWVCDYSPPGNLVGQRPY